MLGVPLVFSRDPASDSAYSFSVMFSYYGLVLDLQSLGRDIFLLQALFGAVDFVGRATNVVFLRFWGRRLTLAGFQALAGFCILANVLVPQGEEGHLGRGGLANIMASHSVPSMWPPSPLLAPRT